MRWHLARVLTPALRSRIASSYFSMARDLVDRASRNSKSHRSERQRPPEVSLLPSMQVLAQRQSQRNRTTGRLFFPAPAEIEPVSRITSLGT